MAANYWESSQKRFWTFTKEQLREKRRKLDEEDRSSVQQYPLPSYRLLGIYIYQQIAKFGKRMALRQQVLATAHIYIKRYYTKVAIRRTNPYLLVATAVYLAGKMEESPSHIRLVLGEARQLFPDMILSDTSKIGECEFGLISELNSQLIVHHPYRSLSELQSQFPLSTEETALAWSIINDHYLTDLPLLHPPHVIAITAVFLAVVLKPSQGSQQPSAHQIAGALNTLKGDGQMPQSRATKLVNWLAETSVDIAAVVDCTQELISQYEVWEQYNEKVVKEQISRYVKGRGLDK